LGVSDDSSLFEEDVDNALHLTAQPKRDGNTSEKTASYMTITTCSNKDVIINDCRVCRIIIVY